MVTQENLPAVRSVQNERKHRGTMGTYGRKGVDQVGGASESRRGEQSQHILYMCEIVKENFPEI